MLRLLATALTLFTVGSATCPEGTFTDAYGTGCFYVVVKRLPWSSAEKMCQVYGGHLASVADCDANSILKLTIPSSPRVEFWLGGKSNEGRWNWADGSEFNYSNWAEGKCGPLACVLLGLEVLRMSICLQARVDRKASLDN